MRKHNLSALPNILTGEIGAIALPLLFLHGYEHYVFEWRLIYMSLLLSIVSS